MNKLCTCHKKLEINLMIKNHVTYILRTCNHCLKTILKLETPFERENYDIFWDISNMHNLI
jgi:hypothetical protein